MFTQTLCILALIATANAKNLRSNADNGKNLHSIEQSCINNSTIMYRHDTMFESTWY